MVGDVLIPLGTIDPELMDEVGFVGIR